MSGIPPGGEGGGWCEGRWCEERARVPYITTGRGRVGRAGVHGGQRREGSVLTQASCGNGAGPGAAGRRAVSNTAPPRMRCH